MRGKHVVVRRDEGDIGRALRNDFEAVVWRDACNRMGNIGASHAIHAGWAAQVSVNFCQVSRAGWLAALGDAGSNEGNAGINRLHG